LLTKLDKKQNDKYQIELRRDISRIKPPLCHLWP